MPGMDRLPWALFASRRLPRSTRAHTRRVSRLATARSERAPVDPCETPIWGNSGSVVANGCGGRFALHAAQEVGLLGLELTIHVPISGMSRTSGSAYLELVLLRKGRIDFSVDPDVARCTLDVDDDGCVVAIEWVDQSDAPEVVRMALGRDGDGTVRLWLTDALDAGETGRERLGEEEGPAL